jgi:hypothetical protein
MNALLTLKPKGTLIKDIERARAIEQSELLALDRLRPKIGDYFTKSEVSVNSIASHWSKFIAQPDIAFSHPQQLEQACLEFTKYLESKKPFNQNGTIDIQGPVCLYVSDRLLAIAFRDGWLGSEKVKQGIHNTLTMRENMGIHYHLNNSAHKRFTERLDNGDFNIETLAQESVNDAFLDVGVILIEKTTTSGRLALEVSNEAA